jgi:hypothetical protein
VANTNNKIRASFVNSLRRKRTGDARRDGGPDFGMAGDWKKKHFTCMNCGSEMEFWYEDRLGDYIYSCKNHYCFKSKDWAGSLTVELRKLAKIQQDNSHLAYRNYGGSY